MIRLAPRTVARVAPIGRGVSLALDAATPAAAKACERDTAMRLAALDHAAARARFDALFDTMWTHFVAAIIDMDGVEHAPTVAARDALFAAAPELDAAARIAVEAQYLAAREAAAEGNVSRASCATASAAGLTPAPIAPPTPVTDAAAAPAGAATDAAPKMTTR